MGSNGDEMTPGARLPFVIFRVKECLYAMPSEYVREILLMPTVTGIPNLPPEIRGVINLRGSVIHLADLRIKLGLCSSQVELDEFLQLLRDREQDHVNWLTELEASVREGRPFRLARDPHKCKFGLWYDQFKTESSLLRTALQRMDQPHKAVHATADAALEKAGRGDFKGALELISARRNDELARLLALFAESRRIITESRREVAVVLGFGTKRMAVSVDSVEAVERIPEENIEPLPSVVAGSNGKLELLVAKRIKTNQTTLLLDQGFFLAQTGEPHKV